ncbi:MAG TPA: acyltransferase family protein [Streptosporangiaceae bacterium]|nr:acyltransferase family protein [Streptosporangiaceae bacterium]
MPKPVGSDQRYMPGLDGLRAIAVLAVIAFHEQFSWAPGGLLGVALFFTLSGYLITDLLLSRWLATGRAQLANFWARRARRLLPALFVMLAIVTAWVTLMDRARLAGLRGPVLAAATYSSNWYLIVQGQSYFSRFAPPQPLDHLWSLAVEEQFYLIWPWLLLAGLFFIRRHRSAGSIRWLALPTLALAAGSAVLMWALYQPAVDPTRVYEGTDTRACGLLVGAALAMVWSSGTASRASRTTSRVLDVPAALGLGVIAVMIWRVGQYSMFLYHGGLTVLAIATAAVVAAAACPGSLVGAALSWRPLRWVGVRSYGIYLWHYPVIVLTTPAGGTEDLPRVAWQIATSIGLAALSWKFVEEPVRHGAINRAWRRVRTRQFGGLGVPKIAAVTGSTGVVIVACAGLAGAVAVPATSTTAALGTGSGALSGSSNSVSHVSGKAAHGAHGNSAESGGPNGPLRTSCTSVAHIGDSTSEGMVSADYLPRHLRLAAQYEDVGVQSVYSNITGARSVVEVLPGTTNGQQAVRQLIKQGFHGCWVIALGTNDTADVAVGSDAGLPARINDMMRVTQGDPVMWVNVVSILRNGPYAEANMQKWNSALTQACARYPNMRVFNWAVLPQRSWFISDGIHYTSAGYAKRGQYIADGLAEAFPHGGANRTCLVSLPSSVTAPQPTPSPSSPAPASTGRASTAPASTGPNGRSPASSQSARPAANRAAR